MFCLLDITFNPCLTNALLGPINGTTSQIVPNATKSKIEERFIESFSFK